MRLIDADAFIAGLEREFDEFSGNSYETAERFRYMQKVKAAISKEPTVKTDAVGCGGKKNE